MLHEIESNLGRAVLICITEIVFVDRYIIPSLTKSCSRSLCVIAAILHPNACGFPSTTFARVILSEIFLNVVMMHWPHVSVRVVAQST